MTSNEHPVWRSHYQEAKIGWTGGQRIPWNGEAMGSFLLPCAPPGVSLSARGCLSGATPREQPWTSAVTLPQGAHRVKRVAEGGVVYVSRALSVSLCAPQMHAQRGARCDPYNTRNCLPPKK